MVRTIRDFDKFSKNFGSLCVTWWNVPITFFLFYIGCGGINIWNIKKIDILLKNHPLQLGIGE